MITSVDARTRAVVAEVASETTPRQVAAHCREAAAAFPELEAMDRHGRADMLCAIATALEERRSDIVASADRETALGEARLNNELTRTTYQFRFLAEVLLDGGYLEAVIDHPRETPMGLQPDLRRMLVPLGPVAVFGASNFPLAFSVPGGDTASALAAGCPVVVKAHDAHPSTSLICELAISEGARRAGMQHRVISLVFGQEAGAGLVQDPAIAAVGFTGSLAGGRHLHDLACRRPTPVPFYGELGALNAVVVGPRAAAARGAEIGKGLAGSFTLGAGQFCTKPGLAFIPEGGDGDRLMGVLTEATAAVPQAPMLSERIAEAFSAGARKLGEVPGVRQAATGNNGGASSGWAGQARVLSAEPSSLEAEGSALLEECFGPVIVVVRYNGQDELRELVGHLHPALTATVHADGADGAELVEVLAVLQHKCGRLVWNGYPTGVAVTWAMHHGGPYPAATSPLHTSVGATAVRRWLRPVSFQDLPEEMLPEELWDAPGPRSLVPRRVDGQFEVGVAQGSGRE